MAVAAAAANPGLAALDLDALDTLVIQYDSQRDVVFVGGIAVGKDDAAEVRAVLQAPNVSDVDLRDCAFGDPDNQQWMSDEMRELLCAALVERPPTLRRLCIGGDVWLAASSSLVVGRHAPTLRHLTLNFSSAVEELPQFTRALQLLAGCPALESVRFEGFRMNEERNGDVFFDVDGSAVEFVGLPGNRGPHDYSYFKPDTLRRLSVLRHVEFGSAIGGGAGRGRVFAMLNELPIASLTLEATDHLALFLHDDFEEEETMQLPSLVELSIVGATGELSATEAPLALDRLAARCPQLLRLVVNLLATPDNPQQAVDSLLAYLADWIAARCRTAAAASLPKELRVVTTLLPGRADMAQTGGAALEPAARRQNLVEQLCALAEANDGTAAVRDDGVALVFGGGGVNIDLILVEQ